MRNFLALTAAVVLVLCATAQAKDPPFQTALDDAKVLVRKGEHIAAAERFGDAVALAHKSSDLGQEQEVADALDDFVSRIGYGGPSATEDGATTDRAEATRTTVLAAVMRKLDKSRCGAYVSAPVLARSVLLLSSESGETASVAEAVSIALVHAKKTGSGRAAAAVASYAEGMKALADGKLEVATAPLDLALEQAGKAGWLDLATHAGTELAGAWARLGNDDQANSALARVAALCDADTPRGVLHRWQSCVHTRLSETSAAVRAPAENAYARLKEPSSVSGAGGAGGNGGDGQPGGSAAVEQISDVGKFLRKAGKSKTFVSAKCTPAGFEIDWEATPDARRTRAFDDGLRYANAGGVTLAFSGRSVGLRMVDLRGLDGQPGESSESSALRALYLLAEGETWSVSKDGVVKIGK